MAGPDSSARLPQINRLRELLQTLVPRIHKNRDRGIGEQNTKATLIEPILEALDWNIRDWDEVHREYRAKSVDSPVDYALKIMRTPRLFLEAKGLGENLAERKWIAQVLGYATVGGVEWCVLTDGDEWHFYNSTAAVDAEEKLFRRVRLSDDDLDEVLDALMLLSRDNIEGNLLEPLWAAHFVDRRVKQALLTLLESQDKGLVRLLRREVSNLKPKQITESLGRLEMEIVSPPVRPSFRATTPVTAPPSNHKTSAVRPDKHRSPKSADVSMSDLLRAGLLKAPVRLFSAYKNHTLEATLLPTGEIEFQGKRYDTPSGAGSAARATITGRPMPTNGWAFWRAEDAAGESRTLKQVRDAYSRG